MNAGRVELDLVAVGKDQVSAMLRQVDAQMRKTAEGAKLVASNTNGIAAQMTSLKGQAAGVNKVREVFENLRSNLGFVGSAVGLVTGAVVGLVGEIANLVTGGDKAARALELWEKNQAALNQALDAGWKALDKFAGSQVEQALSQVNVELTKAQSLLEDIKNDEDEWLKKSKEVERLLRLKAALERDLARDAELTADAWERIERSMRDASTIDFGTVQGPNPFVANSDDPALKLQRNEFGELETEAERTARLKRLEDAKRNNQARKGGGGGRQQTKEEGLDALFGRGKWAEKENPLSKMLEGYESEGDAIDKMIARVADLGNELGEGDGKSGIAVKVDEVAAAFDRLASASSSLDQILPGLSSTFSQISAIWKETDGSAKSLASGVVGSVDAIATAGAAWFKDEKARTRFLGAKELLLAAPMYFYDPAQAAVKTATGLGLLALAGGGGGGGGARGGAGGRSSGSSGGGQSQGTTTVVNNFSMGIGDRQTIRQSLRLSERSSRGTGADTRAAV